ncbi:NAD-dependent epimerase/dehydratase family protein [Coprobacter tertius]|uniref:NAD-dependent epimerase/dehydratase family protein n=1 Tax=Coprobacter tertius TaxID=2944915 RepID=A0ABT1MCY0_9BACT|nr:NAD-dependent epimerase/dehydratase family protein [Coprobacter tertius]MCP9610492.1 NAD-dependent epimerase/dehydratase family protein [Coprobacter tertius]
MKKHLLVAGAGGFIGGFIVEEALNRSFDTWAGIRKSTSREFLTDKRIRFIDLNYSDKDNLVEQLLLLKKSGLVWDYIIWNLGATKCLNNSDFDKINFGLLRNFVDALIEAGTVPRQFIMMSSLGAWGAGDEKNYTPICPEDIPNPETQYGKSKLKAEKYLRSLPGFPYVILRPTGVYGPREKDYLLMMKTIKAGFDFSVGYRKQFITFIYVKDLVKVMFLAIVKGVTQKAYFISDGSAYTSTQFRKYVAKALGKKIVIPVRLPLFVVKAVSCISGYLSSITGKAATLNTDKYRIMKQRNWICDISATVSELGFYPDYPLDKGVAETVNWYKENGWL